MRISDWSSDVCSSDLMDAGSAPDLGALQAIAYGGGRMPPELIERALTLFPNTGFTNAYGLTETSSTVALLGPDDHRSAHQSDDPAVRARLGSVRSEEHTSELQSLMRISSAVFCLKKKTNKQ